MSWYALENVEEAAERTRELLLPFRWGTWLRLMLIVVLTGSGFSFPNMPAGNYPGNNYDSGSNVQSGSAVQSFSNRTVTDSAAHPSSLGPVASTGNAVTGMAFGGVSNVVLVLLALFIPLVLVLFLVGSVFEFIYYQSLLDDAVSIRDNFRKHFWKGVRYFGFRLVVLAAILGGVAALVLGFTLTPVLGVFLLLGFLLAMLPFAIFIGLTQDFVLLEMIETDEGILKSWRTFWPELRREWRQVGLYLVVKLALGIGTGILSITWAVGAGVALLVPFGILGIALYSITPALVLLAVIPGFLAWAFLMLLLQVAVQTYLRYFTVLVYHDVTQ